MTALLFLLAAALDGQHLFPPEARHNHSSSLVELPNGDLFVCWYRGSGERTADDVQVMAARLPKGKKEWSPRYVLTDTPGFPDTNPILFLAQDKRLWVIWSVVMANQWETALLMGRVTARWQRDPVPWDASDPILFVPRDFSAQVLAAIDRLPNLPPHIAKIARERAGSKDFSRRGWMPRVHPLQLKDGRILLPLYSDGYDFSLIAISDDNGKSWSTSLPLVSMGGVQPSLVERNDGSIVAYMRDNGPPPKRALVTESRDRGVTWSEVRDSEIPNPGSSVEVIRLRSGEWLMILNDTEKGRNSLSAWLSADEGRTWQWRRKLEDNPKGSFSYPSVIQARDGSLHVTYSHVIDRQETIKHVRFDASWVKEAAGAR
jgi:predicted neuraminidase